MTRRTADRDHLPTLAAIAVLVFAPAILLHELGHAITTAMVGGDPTLVSSTDMRGDLSAVGRWGFVAIGASGSAVNWLLAGLGLLGLRWSTTATSRWGFWLLAAVNGFLPAWYLVGSPLMGFGDWMTVIQRFEAQIPLRVGAVLLGLGLTWAWWRLSTAELTRLSVEATERATEGAGALLPRAQTSWLAGGALALLAAIFSPLGLAWALPIAAGSTLGTTWPMLPAARSASERIAVSDRASPPVGPSRTLVIAGAIVGVAFVVFVGRGIRL